jgi:hypothetical protein
VWYEPQKQTITFTGFDLPPSNTIPHPIDKEQAAPDESALESALVRGLTHLLYFLLTGQRAEATNAPLAVEARRCHPELPTAVDTALALGSPRLLNGATPNLQEPQPTVTLAEWQALLPPPEVLPSAPAPRTVPQRFTGPTTVAVLGPPDSGAQPQAIIDYPAQVSARLARPRVGDLRYRCWLW